ncbi:MAG TPA: hypothetical protein G4O02_13325 [Caldilineae bacterium]|nr:hypothetical protein [Caldilineae bacterium]
MARPSFSHTLQARQQYLSLIFHKIPGEADWTLLEQGRVLSPSQDSDTQEYNRIGDQNKLRVVQSVMTDVTLRMYVEDNWEEVARILGVVRPPGGWTGNEVIQLDPTVVGDLKIENYDGVTTSANLVATEYINEFSPQTLSVELDAEGDVRIADLSGSAAAYYIIPEAST